MWQKICRRFWNDRSFGTKLSVLLIGVTAIPIVFVTSGMLKVAENQLISSLRYDLQHDLNALEDGFQQVEHRNVAIAKTLGNSVALAQLDLSNPEVISGYKDQLERLLHDGEIGSQASFYILTNTQGQAVVQGTYLISRETSLALPNPTDKVQGGIWSLGVTTAESLTVLPVVGDALRWGDRRSGTMLLQPEQLQLLRLTEQAQLGIQPQKVAGLPLAKQPAPLGTYDVQQGQVGLVVMAVHPIQVKGKLVGSAIVGTLVNRDFHLVDQIKQQNGVASATIFAQDWRVSTNVPLPDGKTRAVGTRAAREVSGTVLDQAERFYGKTNIVGQNYVTAYAPIYGYQAVEVVGRSKPIGMLYVGNPETQINQILANLAWIGYGVGAGILCLVGILAVPTAKSLIASDSQTRQQRQQLSDALDELKQTQVQLVQTEKMSGLGQLVAGVAHEINNPVNFIHGNIHHINQYCQDLLGLLQIYQQEYPEGNPVVDEAVEEMDLAFILSDLPKLLSSVKTGTTRIRTIVLSLRNFSRMDEAEYKQVDLHEGLANSLVILQHRLKASDAMQEIQVIQDYGDLPAIECYAGQMNQVFMNILTNAIDALGDCCLVNGTVWQPTIHIVTRQLDENWVTIYFRDNGPGMDEMVRSKLFDPFFTTKAVGKGTGLGLSISYQIVVEQHGGQLDCRSVLGEGTEFRVKIPVRQLKAG
jgi:signal transduction histidine kinase